MLPFLGSGFDVKITNFEQKLRTEHHMAKFSSSLLARRDFIKYAAAGATAVAALPAYASDRIAKVNGKACLLYTSPSPRDRG